MSEKKTVFSPRQPGALRSETALEIQTRQAQRLVHGRRAADGKPTIIGLTRFGTMIRVIWQGASVDDPWADWRLLQIENDLLLARDTLESLLTRVQKQLQSVRSMDVSVAHSVEPVKVNLTFTNPYGFMAAYLLADYDVLVRAILTGRHIGLFDRDTTERRLSEGGRIVRRAFNSAQGYRYLGVCREDVRQGTQKAARAERHAGRAAAGGHRRDAARRPCTGHPSGIQRPAGHLLDDDEDEDAEDGEGATEMPR